MASQAGSAVYRTARWHRARLATLERAGWRCEACGKAGRLEVHHRRAITDGGAPFDLGNLEAVCRPCHFNRHGRTVRPWPSPALRRAWRRFALEALPDGPR